MLDRKGLLSKPLTRNRKKSSAKNKLLNNLSSKCISLNLNEEPSEARHRTYIILALATRIIYPYEAVMR